MSYERLFVVVVCCGLAAACSSVGPDDGLGGSGGSPTGIAGRGGGGMGGVVTSRGGSGGGVTFTANDLPCLKKLFADCPTEPGTCQYVNVGTGGAPENSSGHLCYASGPTVDTFSSEPDCTSAPTRQKRYYGLVHKSDGTLCYTFLRTCECASACEITQFTFRSATGEVIATGQSGTLTCATGETCAPGGAAGSGGGGCDPVLPGLQCVEGTCP
jgi:hypothetical protein